MASSSMKLLQLPLQRIIKERGCIFKSSEFNAGCTATRLALHLPLANANSYSYNNLQLSRFPVLLSALAVLHTDAKAVILTNADEQGLGLLKTIRRNLKKLHALDEEESSNQIVHSRSHYNYSEQIVDVICSGGKDFNISLISKHKEQRKEGFRLSDVIVQLLTICTWENLHLENSLNILMRGLIHDSDSEQILEHTRLRQRISYPAILETPVLDEHPSRNLLSFCSYELYQIMRSKPDSQVENCMSLFTALSEEERRQVLQEHWKNPSNYTAQKKLAEHVLTLLFDETSYSNAVFTTQTIFNHKANCGYQLEKTSMQKIASSLHWVKLDYSENMSWSDICVRVRLLLLQHRLGPFDDFVAHVHKQRHVYVNGLKAGIDFVLSVNHIDQGATILTLSKQPKTGFFISWT